MSADNWTKCPRCKKQQDQSLAASKARVDEAYGRVPVEQFDRMRRDYEDLRADGRPTTLREDWEIGADDEGEGEFFVSYRASCPCGFSFKFERTIQMEG